MDEYQDLNACDLSVVRSLTNAGAELYAAGDDDQSIYGFRYANPDGIRRFVDEYEPATGLTLAECQRCSQDILDVARSVVQQDPRRIDKPLYSASRLPAGEVHLLRFDDYTDEAVGVANIARWLVDSQRISVDQILVLLRNDRYQKFSSPIRVAFEAQALPSSAVENPLGVLEEPPGRIFLSLLRLIDNSEDSLAWRTLIANRPNRLGSKACASIYEIAQDRGIRFQDAIRLIHDSPNTLPRQGYLVKNEFELASAILTEVRDQDEDEFDKSISRIIDEVGDDQQDAIREVVSTVLEQTRATSIEELLRGIMNPIAGAEQAKVPDCVNIMTMHQAKGLDAQAVIIVGAEDEYVPGRASGAEIDDERRLLYISLTRARTHLFITHCTRRTGIQRNTGSTSGASRRTLTQFLRGGSLRSTAATEFLSGLQA